MTLKIKKKQIILIWIPGHTGIIGNETENKYAKITISNTNITVLNSLTYDDFKNSSKTHKRKNGK